MNDEHFYTEKTYNNNETTILIESDQLSAILKLADMKKITLILLAIFWIAGCNLNKTKEPATVTENNYIEIINFHKRWNDDAWKPVNKYTQQVLNKDFAKQQNDNKIVYNDYDLGTSEGASIALKYKTKGSALIINQWKGNKVTIHNITDFARSTIAHPDSFEMGLKKKIDTLLASD